MGVFSETYIKRLPKVQGLSPDFVINYLKRAETIIDRLRCSEDTKGYLKTGYSLMAAFIPDTREHRKWNIYEYYPEDFEDVDMENPETYPDGLEDRDEVVEAYELELCAIIDDLREMLDDNDDGFYDDDIQGFLDAYESYLDHNDLRDYCNDHIIKDRCEISEELKRQDIEDRY